MDVSRILWMRQRAYLRLTGSGTITFIMRKSYQAERVQGISDPRLPAAMNREIGRIIVHWAYFEHCIQDMVWQTIGVSQAVGRVSVREPKVTDRLEMLRELLTLRQGSWDDKLYKSICERATLLGSKRHLVAHGIWGKSPAGEWTVQLTRGSWPRDAKEHVAGSKKITPEAVLMDASRLSTARSDIQSLIEDLKKLRKSAVGP